MKLPARTALWAPALAALLSLPAAEPASAQTGSDLCTGVIPAVQGYPARKDGPRLRFGITPGVQTGQFVGPPVEAKPNQPERTLAALDGLRAAGSPFVVKLNRFFWSDGEAGIRHFLDLTDRYTRRGFPVELQLRYHPLPDQEGDLSAWVEYVREVVRRFGSNPRVVGLQVANEVNLPISPDSSDGAYTGSQDALIQGVEAASAEAERLGYHQLEVGFNWAYRYIPDADQQFFQYLHDHGGPRFAVAVDWVGLDAYPGTVFPPVNTPDNGERGAMVNALDALRCYLAIAGIPAAVPIHIGENGFPTSEPARSYVRQAEIMENMIRAVDDFRGTYNVTDYRWFNLRDADSSSPNFQQQYGILRDDYSEKPAFGTYRRLVAELGRKEPVAPLLYLRIRCHRGGLRAAVVGPDSGRVKRVDFLVGHRRVARDGRRPFARAISRGRLAGPARRLRARIVLRDGRLLALAHLLPACVS